MFRVTTIVQSQGVYFWEFLVELCGPVLQILARFQTKECHFSHPFSDHTSKIHTCFQTWPLGRNYVIITQIRAQTKNCSNTFRIRIFLFRSYSFGIETINAFIHSRSSFENHTQFQTKMGKVYNPFQTKKAQKPYHFGRYTPINLVPKVLSYPSLRSDTGRRENPGTRLHTHMAYIRLYLLPPEYNVD